MPTPKQLVPAAPRAPAAGRRLPAIAAVLFALVAGAHTADASDDAFPGVFVHDEVERYAVGGRRLADLRRNLEARARAHAEAGDGRTRSRIDVAYTLEPGPGSCRVAAARIHVHVTTVLPEWQPGREVTDAARQRWDEALARLVQHEQRHRQHALAAAEAMREDLLALPAQDDCLKLQLAIGDRRWRALLRLELRDNAFDAWTDFGRRDRPERPPEDG